MFQLCLDAQVLNNRAGAAASWVLPAISWVFSAHREYSLRGADLGSQLDLGFAFTVPLEIAVEQTQVCGACCFFFSAGRSPWISCN